MKKLFVPFLFVLSGFAFSQNFTRIVKITPKESKDSDVLKVYEVDRKTEVTGNYSSTTIEYMIENKSSRTLEGEFEFPLDEGESVAGYALDINGKMREGVAVEKEKGRQVFEEIVRRGIDPGLIEKTEGNNFKTRVYPITANGVRHIKITVEKEVFDESLKQKVFTQTVGKKTYFYFFDSISESEKSVRDLKNKPLTVLFDVSGSAKNRDVKKEVEFLKKYVNHYKINDVKILTFANSIVEELDYSKVDTLLSGPFDGATNFSCLNQDFSNRHVLFFSDGLENWNNREGISVKAVSLSAVSSSGSANFSKLKQLSSINNGVFVNLSDKSIEEGLRIIEQNPVRILSVEYNDGDFSEFYTGTKSVENGIYSAGGILNRKSGKIKINLGRDNKVLKSTEITVSAIEGESIESEKVSRLWAMKKIAELEPDYDLNKNQIMELAKKFTIVTKDTSLIVLENASDYVKYEIEPPEELKEECKRISERGFNGKIRKSGISEQVYRLFEEYKKWWNTKPGNFKMEHDRRFPSPFSGSARTSERNMMRLESAMVTDEMIVEDREVAAPMMANRVTANKALSAEPESKDAPVAAAVKLQAWSSDAEYLSVLKKTASEKMYEKYLELKKTYGSSPAFYIEVSDYFADEGLKDLSVRILSNLAEMNLENTDVLRALGNKLYEKGYFNEAIKVFEKLTKLRSGIPQFYRDLALCYESAGQHQKAVQSLWHIVSNNWDPRYSEIQQTALNDMNAIIENSKEKLDLSQIDKKLQKNFDVDLRIVLTWNTDDCDVDLWVTDPDGEKCYYGHKLTVLGGRMSRDFTQGYGPEEFDLKVAKKGIYKIEANYFGNRQQKVLQPVIVQAEVYTNFGRPDQKKQILNLQLEGVKQTFFIGEIEVE